MPITDSNKTTDRGNDAVEVLSSDGSGFGARVDSDGRVFVRDDNPIIIGDESSFTAKWGPKLRYVDMNSSSGGVNRNTNISSNWTQLFSYSGSGYLMGFSIKGDDIDDWYFRLQIDGEEVFLGTDGIRMEDLDTDYDFESQFGDGDVYPMIMGLHFKKDMFRFSPYHPVRYLQSVKVFGRVQSGNEVFEGGLIALSKET